MPRPRQQQREQQAPALAVDPVYWAAAEACVVCRGVDYCAGGHGPRTLVTCDCCLDNGVHVECWAGRTGEELSEERLASPAFQWFCSEASD